MKAVLGPEVYAALDFAEGLAEVAVWQGDTGRWGFIDRSFRLAIKPMFGQASSFSEGLACVAPARNERYGYIDKSGSVVIPAVFDYAESFSEGLASVRKDGRVGYIDTTGTWQPQLPFAGRAFRDGLAPILADRSWHFVDRDGAIVIRGQHYTDATPFSQGLAAVKIGKLWGFIDRSGYLGIDIQFEEVGRFSEELCAVRQGGKWGYIDKAGRFAINAKFEDAGEFHEGLAEVSYRNWWGAKRRSVINECGMYVWRSS